MKHLDQAKSVAQAVIYKKGRAAATLTRHPSMGVVFSYLPSYLSGGGPAMLKTPRGSYDAALRQQDVERNQEVEVGHRHFG